MIFRKTEVPTAEAIEAEPTAAPQPAASTPQPRPYRFCKPDPCVRLLLHYDNQQGELLGYSQNSDRSITFMFRGRFGHWWTQTDFVDGKTIVDTMDFWRAEQTFRGLQTRTTQDQYPLATEA